MKICDVAVDVVNTVEHLTTKESDISLGSW